jgi:hypothetical protein
MVALLASASLSLVADPMVNGNNPPTRNVPCPLLPLTDPCHDTPVIPPPQEPPPMGVSAPGTELLVGVGIALLVYWRTRW